MEELPGRDKMSGPHAERRVVLPGEELGDLHRVGRRALAQVVRDDEEGEAVRAREVRADAADQGVVIASGEERHRIDVLGEGVDHLHAGGLAEQLAGLVGAEGLLEEEVRGLGVLNIRTIFGEAALRPRKNIKLIVHLEKPAGSDAQYVERLPLKPGEHEILGVKISKVTIPVAAGRNLAVLVEAAVRNHVLQMRGIDSTQEFIARQTQEMNERQPKAPDDV